MNHVQFDRMEHAEGFIAALDQSGGSTPKALKAYGIAEDAYHNDDEMFALVHQMRTRIITSPAFTSNKILGAILFENTMDRQIEGRFTADYLWEVKGIIPFLKVDQGLAAENNGVQLMKPIVGIDDLLVRAKEQHIFGTKMRSVIKAANKKGIEEIVQQQFEYAKKIISHGLVPIIEPEVDIHIPDKKEAEVILKESLLNELLKLGPEEQVIFKLSIPTVDDFYKDLMKAPHVVRIVALSGGYSREEANALLAKNHGLIASFSRALSEGLSAKQSEADFDKTLASAIDSIYQASNT